MDYKITQTYKDITEIPYLLEELNVNFKNYISNFDFKKIKEVFLLGRGSSGNATLFGKYVFEMYCGVIGNIVHPYSIFNAVKKMDYKNRILMVYSQSGKTRDIVKCTQIVKDWGARVVSVTNEPENPLKKISDRHILLSNSKEIPVAATKSFILQLWSVFKFAEKFGFKYPENTLKKVIKTVRYVIDDFEKIYRFYRFDKLLDFNMIGVVGRGPLNAIAEDAALKFREMSQIHSLGYSSAEFLHGPVGSFGKSDVVLVLAKNKTPNRDIKMLLDKLKEKGIKYFIIYPFDRNYPFSTLAVDVFLKLVALKIAVLKGVNPDKPQGLTKVTNT